MREQMADCQALVVESFKVGREDLAAAPGLKVVQKFGAVLRNIDTAACNAAGVIVVNQSGTNSEPVAEHAMALMLGLLRRGPRMYRFDALTQRLLKQLHVPKKWRQRAAKLPQDRDLTAAELEPLTLSGLEQFSDRPDRDVLAVHDSLLAFEALDPRAAKVVELEMHVSDGMKMIISGGTVLPPGTGPKA